MPIPSLKPVASVEAAASADAAVLVLPPAAELSPLPFAAAVSAAMSADAAMASAVCLLHAAGAPGGRVIVSPTGPLNRDFDDVRRVAEAVVKGITRAVAAGARSPLLILPAALRASEAFANVLTVALIAVGDALHAPFSTRAFRGEAAAETVTEVHALWLGAASAEEVAAAARAASAITLGRRVCKDIGGGDPEVMAPPRAAAYVQEAFAGTVVKVSVEEDADKIAKEYPCAGAVARASLHVPRHAPRIVRLEYTGEGPITEQVYFIGKGITYDTGGADVKVGGHMVNMSRDKCGAAAVAGFMRSVAELKPKGLRVVALLAFVRNSIGSDAYVADEIITARSGKRILVVNTDAEGRMAMVDLLAQAREEIEAQPRDVRPPTFVHTVATLTGHAVLAVGLGYSISVDNGAARAAGVGASLQALGDAWADPFEVSTLRREDFDFVAPKTREYDVKQVNNAPSSQTPRGHQFPAAVLALGSGFDRHGLESDDPIAYSHLDVAASTVAAPYIDGVVTGQPVTVLVAKYALKA